MAGLHGSSPGMILQEWDPLGGGSKRDANLFMLVVAYLFLVDTQITMPFVVVLLLGGSSHLVIAN